MEKKVKKFVKFNLKKNNKFFTSSVKAQITVFVILGMLFLFLVAFVLYATQLSTQSELNRQADSIVNDFTALRDVQDYTQLALANAANEGIEKILLQGGYLTDNLDPVFEGKKYLPYTYTQLLYDGRVITSNSKVYYGIVENVPCHLFKSDYPNILVENTSFYPVKQEWLKNYERRYNSWIFQGGCMPYEQSNAYYSGFLGGYSFPALCSFDGANVPKTINGIPQANAASCAPNQYDYFYNQNAIQRQLEFFLEENLQNYINESYFAKRGTNISFNLNNSNISVFYKKPTGLVVTLKLNADVKIHNQVFQKELKFNTEIDGSFRQLHSYVQDLLMHLVKDPFFNLTSDWNNTDKLLTYKPSIKLFIHKEVCKKQNNCLFGESIDDDIYTFVDTMNQINSRPLTMNVAIQNRRPVLDYIHDTNYNNLIAGYYLDKQYYTNSTLLLNPLAIDPDLDKINYTYYGWKQNYNQYLNMTCCEEQGGCNITNHINCYLPTELMLDDDPNSLMNSELYRSTHKFVSHQLNESDMGYHNITLVINDEHGFMDFQIIKILVFDLPKAVLNFDNNFEDVDNNFASIEDFFTLDASLSQTSSFIGGGFSKILFFDDDEPFNPPLLTQELEYVIPNKSYDLSNITLGYFSFHSLNDVFSLTNDKSKLHKISLIVTQQVDGGQEIQSSPDFKTVTVSECLPHGYNNPEGTTWLDKFNFNEQTPSSWPYPFNPNFDEAPHICCDPFDKTLSTNHGGGEFISASSNTVCFEKDFYTVYPFKNYPEMVYLKNMIKDTSGLIESSETFDTRNLGQYPAVNSFDDSFNDVFEISVQQKCSGTRGNVCSGDVVFKTLKSALDCEDLEKSYQFARCQTPYNHKDLLFNDAGTEVSESFVCRNLNKKSFELNFYNSIPDTVKKEEYLKSFSEGITNFDENLFFKGYCGESDEFNLDEFGKLNNFEDGVFDCLPTCSGTKGCDYTQLQDCKCNNIGNSYCKDLTADSFFENGEEYYVCINEPDYKGACDRTCSFSTIKRTSIHHMFSFLNDQAACLCAISGLDKVPANPSTTYFYGTHSLTKDEITSFFSPMYRSYDYISGERIFGSDCCTEGVVMHKIGHNSQVCFNGQYINKFEPFGGNRFISLEGGLISCNLPSDKPTYDAVAFFTGGFIGNYECTTEGWVKIS